MIKKGKVFEIHSRLRPWRRNFNSFRNEKEKEEAKETKNLHENCGRSWVIGSLRARQLASCSHVYPEKEEKK